MQSQTSLFLRWFVGLAASLTIVASVSAQTWAAGTIVYRDRLTRVVQTAALARAEPARTPVDLEPCRVLDDRGDVVFVETAFVASERYAVIRGFVEKASLATAVPELDFWPRSKKAHT